MRTGVYDDGDKPLDLGALQVLAKPDLDAVIVDLPITMQPGVVSKALHASKHVLSEKPVAPDVQQGFSLIKAHKERYNPKGLI